jgi:hypothetical protein
MLTLRSLHFLEVETKLDYWTRPKLGTLRYKIEEFRFYSEESWLKEM